MKKEALIKLGKWVFGLGLGVLATYGVYVFYNTGKSKEVVDTTGMNSYQLTVPYSYENAISNIYDVLGKFKYADIWQGVIKDSSGNPTTIVLNIMALPNDADAINQKLITIVPEVKFTVINSNQPTINP